MDYETKDVSVRDISLADRTFVITTQPHNELLQKSIERFGVLHPPWLYFDNDARHYVIVCGLRRISACIAAGRKEITARIIGQGSEARDVLLLSLYDNLSHRALDPVEKARAARKLLNYLSADTVIREYLPLMGLPPAEKALAQLLCLARLEQEIQDSVAQGRISEAAAVRLAHLAVDDRKVLFELLCLVHLSASKQEEVLSHCMDISLREGTGCKELVQDREIQDLIAEEKLSRSQKGDRVRAVLRRKRFPRLSLREEDFFRQRKKMHLPAGVQLSPPPFFEGGRYRIEIEFSRADELQKKAEEVLRLAGSPLLRDMVESA